MQIFEEVITANLQTHHKKFKHIFGQTWHLSDALNTTMDWATHVMFAWTY